MGKSLSDSILVSMGKHYEICVSGKVIRTFNHLKVNAFIDLALASSVHFVCLVGIFKRSLEKKKKLDQLSQLCLF